MPSVGIYLRGRIQVIRVSDNGQFDVGSPDLHIEEVGCAVCGADGSRRIFTEHYRLGPDDHEYELGVNRCLTCGQVYVSPRLDESSTEVVYRLDTERTISHAYCWAGQTSDHRFEPLLDRITKRVPNGRMLDVGCGTGSFLSAASRRQRWELTGLEPVESAARLAANNAHGTIHRCTLEEAHLPSAALRRGRAAWRSRTLAFSGRYVAEYSPYSKTRRVPRRLCAELSLSPPQGHRAGLLASIASLVESLATRTPVSLHAGTAPADSWSDRF